jgi:spermidine synthase
MHVYLGDARQYIEKVPAPLYDVIVLDAFSGDTVPAHLTTQEFLEAVHRAVRPSGVVVGNVWKRSSNRLYDAMRRTYQEVFDALLILDVPGDVNAIFLALPRPPSVSRSELAQRAHAISISQRLPFDLGESVMQGFSDVRDKDSTERVLHDSR